MNPSQAELAACTIIAKNYLPMALVLADSWHRFHPDLPFFALVIDEYKGFFAPDAEGLQLISAADLDIPHVESLFFKYSILEATTAVKPYLLAHLFRQYSPKKLVYLDADILILRALDGLSKKLDTCTGLLTPHLLAPIPADGMRQNDHDILRAGSYNLGFLGLRNCLEAERLLQWWSSKLYHHCIIAFEDNLFVDQRWMDLVPGLFEGICIIRDPGYNVAYWNLHERAVSVETEARVNGGPLYFFHFSGFNPDKPWLVSKYQHRYDMESVGPARELYMHYRDLVVQKGWNETKSWPYDHDFFANGTRISTSMRRHFWKLGPDVSHLGNPFLWLGTGAKYQNRGYTDGTSSKLSGGVNLLESVESGDSSEDAEGSLRTITAAELSYVIQSVRDDRTYSRETLSRAFAEENSYHINLFLLAPEALQSFARDKSSHLAGHFNIAYLDWPGPSFPREWTTIFGDVDEVWVPSAHVQHAIAPFCPAPVTVIHPSVDPSPAVQPEWSAPAEEMSGCFSFTFAFDLRSCFERKFPLGLIRAFRNAFGDRRDVQLLIHCFNSSQDTQKVLDMQRAITGTNVKILNQPMTTTTRLQLLNHASCYVSLHRAEAFGLILAEAMSLGKAVIATGYSGNLDFMSDEDSFLLPYRMVEIKENQRPYKAGQHWAEPDQDYAVDIMRYVESNREKAAEVGAKARTKVRSILEPTRNGGAVRRRLSDLGLL